MGVATRLLREAVRLKFSLGSVNMASVYECTREDVRQIQETVIRYRAGLITLGDMYERLIGLQGNIIEALGLQGHMHEEGVAYEKFRRLVHVASIPREERRNSLS